MGSDSLAKVYQAKRTHFEFPNKNIAFYKMYNLRHELFGECSFHCLCCTVNKGMIKRVHKERRRWRCSFHKRRDETQDRKWHGAPWGLWERAAQGGVGTVAQEGVSRKTGFPHLTLSSALLISCSFIWKVNINTW